MENHHITAVAADTVKGTDLVPFEEFSKDLESSITDLKLVHDRLSTNLSDIESADPSEIPDIRAAVERDIDNAFNNSNLLALRLVSLDHANQANRLLPNCGDGTSIDTIRTGVVNRLMLSLTGLRDSFSELRFQVLDCERKELKDLYYVVSGQWADESKLDELMSAGGKDALLAMTLLGTTLVHDGDGMSSVMKGLVTDLLYLEEAFFDLNLLIDQQGKKWNIVDKNIAEAASAVREGNEELEVASELSKKNKRWWLWGLGLVSVGVAAVGVAAVAAATATVVSIRRRGVTIVNNVVVPPSSGPPPSSGFGPVST